MTASRELPLPHGGYVYTVYTASALSQSSPHSLTLTLNEHPSPEQRRSRPSGSPDGDFGSRPSDPYWVTLRARWATLRAS